MVSSCCWRSRARCSASPFSIAVSTAAPSDLTSLHSSSAFCSSSRPADRRDGLVDVVDDRADVDARGDGLHQRARVDRRIEQRELTHDALDVHAVADLEQAVADAGPSTRAAGRSAGSQKYSDRPIPNTASAPVEPDEPLAGARDRVERELVLQLDQGVAEVVDPGGLQLRVGLRRPLAARRHPLRLGPEQVRGQHVDLRGLVERLDRVLAEQEVAPRDEVVEILHDDVHLVGEIAAAGDHVRLERLVAPRGDRLLEARLELRLAGFGELLQHLVDELRRRLLAEAEELPEPLRNGLRRRCSSGRTRSGTSAAPPRSAGSC